MQVLTVARWYPSHDFPGRGSFVSDLVAATVDAGVDARVASFDRVLVHAMQSEHLEKIHARAREAYDAVATPDDLFTVPLSRGARGVPVARIPVVQLPGVPGAEALIEDHLAALRTFLAHLVEQWRPDVIHAHTGLPDGIIAAELGREHGIPVVVTEHMSTIETVLADPIALARYRTLLEPDVQLLAVSPSMVERLATLLGAPSGTIGVLANPVAVADFAFADDSDREPATLLWVGSLGPHKEIAVLLQAVALLLRRRPGLRLRVVGGERHDGDLAALEALARELAISDAVSFEGWLERTEVADAMLRSTVFVHPSPAETFGVVAAEAILTGLPVATRRSGGVPWIVERSGGFGAVAEDDGPESFADAIEAVLDRPLPVDGATARKRLAAEFGADAVAEDALRLYQVAADRGGGATSSGSGRASFRSVSPPGLVAARGRNQARRFVPLLPEDVRRRLLLVVPSPAPGATHVPLDDLGVQVIEAGHAPATDDRAGRPAKRGWRRREPSEPPTSKQLFAAAILAAAEGVRDGGDAVEVVAVDAPCAAIVAGMDQSQVRLGAGTLRWLADAWDASDLPPAEAAPAARATTYDSVEGPTADLDAWLHRALERNVRSFVRRHRVLGGVEDAFGVGSGEWVRLWHDLGVPRVDGCDRATDIGAAASGLPDKQFGFVSVMNVLSHVTDDVAFEQALTTIADLVAPGGRLLLVEPAVVNADYEGPVEQGQDTCARTVSAYREPLVAAGLEMLAVRGAVALAGQPIEAASAGAYARYQRWWSWVGRTSRESPERVQFLGRLMLTLDRATLLTGAAPSIKILLLQRRRSPRT